MGILDAAPWALEKRLLLQPLTKLPECARIWPRGSAASRSLSRL